MSYREEVKSTITTTDQPPVNQRVLRVLSKLDPSLKKHFTYFRLNEFSVGGVGQEFRISLSITVAQWDRLPLGTDTVVSSIPGSVGYISHVH